MEQIFESKEGKPRAHLLNFCFWINCTIISRAPKLWVGKLGRAGEKEKRKNGLGQKRILLMERDSQSVRRGKVQGVRTPRAPLGTERLFNKALSRAEEKTLRCLRGNLGRVAGLRRDSLIAQSVKNLPALQETRLWFLGGKDLLEEEIHWQPTPVCLPRKCYGQRSLEGYNLWDHKSWTQLIQTWIFLIVDLYEFFKNIFWLQVPYQIHDLQIFFFFHSVDCIFTFFLLSLEAQVFNFVEDQFIFSIVSIVAYAFNFMSKKSLPNSGSQRYTPIFFWQLYSFSSYI